MSKKDQEKNLDGILEETQGLQVFDVSEIDNIVVGRDGGSGIGQEIREVLKEEMADVPKGGAVILRVLVGKVRERIAAKGEEDPGYQPVCTRMRNIVDGSKLYFKKTNVNKVTFVIKK